MAAGGGEVKGVTGRNKACARMVTRHHHSHISALLATVSRFVAIRGNGGSDRLLRGSGHRASLTHILSPMRKATPAA